METQFDGILVIVGSYGSGKSEVSINLAIDQKEKGVDVTIADLDLVNPYFRTREARQLLSDKKINVILPPAAYMQADLPILDPKVYGAINKSSGLTVLDVGGDNVGATVLAALQDHFSKRPCHMLQVINPFRPGTNTIEGCLKKREEIETASKMAVTGFIGNPNLMDETLPEHIYQGTDFIKNLSKEASLPLAFISVMKKILSAIDSSKISSPTLPMVRQLIFPWNK